MKFLIQRGFYASERNYYLLDDMLSKYNIDFDLVSIAPFVGEIYHYETDDMDKTLFNRKYDFTGLSNVIFMGSVKLAKVAATMNDKLSPGSFFNENHDYEVYSQYYKDNLLNYDSKIINFGDELPPDTPYIFFARPAKDSKLWTGREFTHDAYYNSIENLLQNNKAVMDNGEVLEVRPNLLSERIQICKSKKIISETRCFVVKGKVITMSEYMRGGKVIYKNVDDNIVLRDEVQSFVDMFYLSDGFVMDVCELSDGSLKIVEINCLNCSGFYDINMSKLIQSLVENFSL